MASKASSLAGVDSAASSLPLRKEVSALPEASAAPMNEPLIAPPAGRPLSATLAHAWAAADQPWTPAVEASGWELMMRFAELGLGVAIVNDFCSPPRGTVRTAPIGPPLGAVSAAPPTRSSAVPSRPSA